MYSVRKIQINDKHPLFEWCTLLCSGANCMYNAALFRIRQCMTGLSKKEDERHPLEQEVLDEIEAMLPAMNKGKGKRKADSKCEFVMPTKEKWLLGYNFLDAFFKITDNPDYYRKGFPVHAAQNAIKQAVRDMKSFFALKRDYKDNPKKYLGEPNLPGYKKSGGLTIATLDSKADVVYQPESGKFKLPKTKLLLDAGKDFNGELQEAKIVPTHGIFVFTLVFFQEDQVFELPEPSRIAALDMGVENFAAITTSTGNKSLLVKGGAIKAAKHEQSLRMKKFQEGQTKRTKGKFIPTKRYQKMMFRFQNRTHDLICKMAVKVINWLKENEIDTLVVGHNKGQKQSANMGRDNNRTFCTIPFDDFRWQLAYRCQKEGIRYLETEESYTSKSSFLDQDELPVWNGKHQEYAFSGKRITRGQYRSKEGITINADLNGAANIGRKLFPTFFVPENVCFETEIHKFGKPVPAV